MSDLPALDSLESTLRDALGAIQEKLKPLGGKSGVADDLREALLGLVAHVRDIEGRVTELEDRLDDLEEEAEAVAEEDDD